MAERFRAVIIDDEYWALKGIENSCDWESFGVEVVLSATDPAAAKNRILAGDIDCVLIDVRMGEINGLDMIEELRGEGVRAEFIVISGHDQFEYAKRGITLGVFDYILKPIDKPEVVAAVKRLAARLKEKRDAAREQDATALLLSGFPDNPAALDVYLERRRFTDDSLWRQVAIVKGGGVSPADIFPARSELLVLGERMYALFIQKNAEEIPSALWQQIIGENGTMGLSESARSDWNSLYFQAYLSLNTDFNGAAEKIRRYVTDGQTRARCETDMRKAAQKLIQAKFHAEERSAAGDYIRKMELWAGTKGIYPDSVLEWYRQLFFWMKANGRYSRFLDREVTSVHQICEEYHSAENLCAYLREILETGADEKNEEMSAARVCEMQSFMEEHYAENLYLKDMAGRFYFTQTYICDLFRKHLGKTFSGLLQEIRIKNAQRLLRESKLPLAEIASQVGYPDISYFVRVFKKLSGLTPLQYRRKAQSPEREEQ